MASYIYLASQSPRRRQLLEQLGVGHELLLPNAVGDIAEDAEAIEAELPGENPHDYVQRVTAGKLDAAVARHARRGLPDAPILCSDTTVALGPQILGKPVDADDARRILRLLSGAEHEVLTAIAVQSGAQRLQALSVSTVRFAPMTDAQIDAYVATGEPMGKAGAYGIQGMAAAHIAEIRGSYSAIMGLPVFETAGLLRQLGWAL
ncbi:Maf family nucleotide pyrophosphatase [Comamonas sp. Y33R10-2]|uniref:Maf family protein n=1 Tax=Comamonas sp. Y33R10-2 TaxID=2853257 RepID=UPI001C5CAA25|nr:Maf family protein [Comamonas sp. Y33R10-2]QXZ11163.1 Maf family nucleotide pyrophosphatase [Comamonas sp. Y33R10-2]